MKKTQKDKHDMYYKWILAVKQKIIILESTDTEKERGKFWGWGTHRFP